MLLLETHENFTRLLRSHPAVRLLRKDTAPLIVTFLWSAFREQRHAAYGSRELTTRLDAQLEALDRGELGMLGDTGIRERFLLIEDTASRLLSDFRAIEDNFRRLNAAAREELLRQHASRGEVLEHIFDSRERILDSDQGRTFSAFWEFLMDQRRREEQEKHLAQLADLPELNDLYGRAFLPRMETALVDAGDRVNRTTERLVEQLRRFVQTRAFSENQRVTNLIGKIERLAVAVKTDPLPNRGFASIDGSAAINLTMDRGVFAPPA